MNQNTQDVKNDFFLIWTRQNNVPIFGIIVIEVCRERQRRQWRRRWERSPKWDAQMRPHYTV